MKAALPGLWHRLQRSVGGWRLLALALLLLALLLGFWVLQLDSQTDALRATIRDRRAAQPAQAAPTRRVPLAEQVEDFVAAFPPLQESAADLEQVFQSARKHNLQLPRGEYKFKQEANEPLASYTATFPVKADYAALRDFSADVLGALPNASMEELRMARSSADSTLLEAVVRFTLVYRR
jgi:hypothetical protein